MSKRWAVLAATTTLLCLLTASPALGHEVVVYGYEGEPFARVLPDGTVQAAPLWCDRAASAREGNADAAGGLEDARRPT